MAWTSQVKSPEIKSPLSLSLSILRHESGSVLEETTSKLRGEQVSSWGQEAASAEA